MSEDVREEWLLTFTLDSDSLLFGEGIRQKVMYVMDESRVPHFAWFNDAAGAKLGRAIAKSAGAWDVGLKHRTVTTIATDWEDVS